ncbi:MAG: class I adenylate-forming enzyme family protein [Pseudomonadales bacterium]|jgi:long-chain acyl-CoA synthetase
MSDNPHPETPDTAAAREAAIQALTAPGGPFELVADTDRRGQPIRRYATGPQTLREVLTGTRTFGDRIYLVFEDERISYGTHHQRVAQLAHWLEGQGVGKGDRVAIGMRNYPEWVIGFFACQAIGAVAVLLNAWWTGAELVYGLTDSGARVALLDDERYARLEPLLAAVPDVTLLVTRDIERRFDATAWDDALAAFSHETELPAAEIGADDYATIIYTSGTTGVPKGALHTHRNHVTNITNALLSGAAAAALAAPAASDEEPAASDEEPAASTQPPQPSSLQTFPFFHIGGLSGLYISAITGSKLVLMYKWDVNQAFDLISREKISGWSGVPTVVRELLEHPRATSGELDSLASIASGGAPVPEDLINRVGSLFQSRVAPGNGYGATETTSAIISNGGADYLARPGSVGRPTVTVDVRIVDDAGQDLADGEIGELWLRGPNIFAGYWNRPEETEASFSDGWFKTGDLAYRSEEGFYYVVDRKKDVIIRGGENVYCAEVESVLHHHPDIADVALIGLPHRALGEEVAAVIERKPEAELSEADVQAWVAERLARFNVPTRVFFIEEPLPRTATGKVLKRELKERYAGAGS